MKKIIFWIALAAASAAHADGYLALDYANAKFSVDCDAGNTCSQKRGGLALRWGAPLPESYSLKLGDFSVDTMEAGWFKSGRRTSSGSALEYVLVGGTTRQTSVPFSNELSAQGIYGAVVGRYTIAPDWFAYGRLGLAYVNTTNSLTHNNLSAGSVTENHWSPLLGLGVEYAVIPNFKLNAGIQAYKVKTTTVSDPSLASTLESRTISGTVRELTLGGRYDF